MGRFALAGLDLGTLFPLLRRLDAMLRPLLKVGLMGTHADAWLPDSRIAFHGGWGKAGIVQGALPLPLSLVCAQV